MKADTCRRAATRQQWTQRQIWGPNRACCNGAVTVPGRLSRTSKAALAPSKDVGGGSFRTFLHGSRVRFRASTRWASRLLSSPAVHYGHTPDPLSIVLANMVEQGYILRNCLDNFDHAMSCCLERFQKPAQTVAADAIAKTSPLHYTSCRLDKVQPIESVHWGFDPVRH